MNLSELNLSVRDFNAVKRFGVNSVEELVERLPYFCEHAKATAGRVTEALHECGMLPFKLGQWVEPDQCGEEIGPEELEAGEFVVMGFPTESKDWRKVVMIRAADGDDLLYLDGSGGAPHCRLGDHRVWSIRSEKEEEPNMNEDKTTVIVSEDYTRAVTLTRNIIANAQAAQQSLYEVCKGLKEMRDGKLYKELGYQNFEDYTENEVGIGRAHAYRYLSIAENLTEDFVSSMRQIGTTKLALLAKLDEPTRETVQETVDVESVTVRELKAQITTLTAERDEANAAIEKKDKQFRQAMDSKNNELTEVKAGWKRRSDTLLEKIAALQKELEEAKAEPQEVAVEDTSRVEELQKQLEQAQAELAEAHAQLAERPMVQEALPVADTTDAFKAYMSAAADSMRRLLEFVGRRPNDPNREMYLSRIDGVLNLSNTELSKLKGAASCQ